ncbi:isopentenyl-diphosphate Delta-isomerase [Winslowiella toletana]|nr:isopentenyl-diphosphate Delta-isomerase [Winslowiella toletana]
MHDKGSPDDESLILVDDSDCQIGVAGKLQVHQLGILHRAFSIFVFDDAGRLLLQQRASGKYHSAGLWSNTCCGHPRAQEETHCAALRRLQEEMGFQCKLQWVTAFIYRAELANGLIEHEYDHLYIGVFGGTPQPDPAEVADWAWRSPDEVGQALSAHPADFTIWFTKIVRQQPRLLRSGWKDFHPD